MNKIEKVSLVGLGALGTVVAAHLLAAPQCKRLHIVMNERRREQLLRDGLYYNGKQIYFTTVSPEQGQGDSDLIIVAVKYNALSQALTDIRSHVGANTQIMVLLNGLVSEEQTADIYGWNRVLYSMVVGVDARKEGNQVISSCPGVIHFGEANNSTLSQRVLKIKSLFDAAAIPATIPQDMLRTLWWKLMVNVGMNQTSAILNAPYSAFQESESPAREIMLSAQREVVRVAQAAGIALSECDIDEWLSMLMKLAPDGCTSMVQDLRAGRMTEVDYLGGTIVEKGRNYGVETPVNDILVKIIHGLEISERSKTHA